MGRRTAREQARLFVVEGRKSLDEAIAAGAQVETVYVDPSAASPPDLEVVAAAQSAGAAVVEVQPGVLTRACDTVAAQPVAATVRAVDVNLGELARLRPQLVAVLAGVADPGNAGSILRSVAAAGGGSLVLCEGAVDLYNPKTVRSSAGAIFRVPVVKGVAAEEAGAELKSLGFRVVAASAGEGRVYTEIDLSGPVAVALGNEAHGLPPAIAASADDTVHIPMASGLESLGVAAAAAVIFFEAARQRCVTARPAAGAA